MAPAWLRLLGGLAVVGVVALGVPYAAMADPVAVLAAVQGKVEVVPARGKVPQRATFGRPLSKGDRIIVATGGSATVFFNDGNVIELDQKSAITVGGRADARSAAAAAKGLPGEVYRQVSKFVTSGSRQTGLVAVSELRGGESEAPFLGAPRRTALLTDRPEFSWRAIEGASGYHVKLSTAEGELWAREATTSVLPYPSDEPSLVPDKDHLWELEARSGPKVLKRESSVFRILSAETARAVRDNLARIHEGAGGPDSPASHYLAGTYLFGIGLYQDASLRFEALCKLSPDSPAPHEALGSVYSALGLMDRAAAEYQQALALTREP
jgi:hypothetical protein